MTTLRQRSDNVVICCRPLCNRLVRALHTSMFVTYSWPLFWASPGLGCNIISLPPKVVLDLSFSFLCSECDNALLFASCLIVWKSTVLILLSVITISLLSSIPSASKPYHIFVIPRRAFDIYDWTIYPNPPRNIKNVSGPTSIMMDWGSLCPPIDSFLFLSTFAVLISYNGACSYQTSPSGT